MIANTHLMEGCAFDIVLLSPGSSCAIELYIVPCKRAFRSNSHVQGLQILWFFRYNVSPVDSRVVAALLMMSSQHGHSTIQK